MKRSKLQLPRKINVKDTKLGEGAQASVLTCSENRFDQFHYCMVLVKIITFTCS